MRMSLTCYIKRIGVIVQAISCFAALASCSRSDWNEHCSSDGSVTACLGVTYRGEAIRDARLSLRNTSGSSLMLLATDYTPRIFVEVHFSSNPTSRGLRSRTYTRTGNLEDGEKSGGFPAEGLRTLLPGESVVYPVDWRAIHSQVPGAISVSIFVSQNRRWVGPQLNPSWVAPAEVWVGEIRTPEVQVRLSRGS